MCSSAPDSNLGNGDWGPPRWLEHVSSTVTVGRSPGSARNLGSPPTPCVATCSWLEWLCAHRTNGIARRLGDVYRPELNAWNEPSAVERPGISTCIGCVEVRVSVLGR